LEALKTTISKNSILAGRGGGVPLFVGKVCYREFPPERIREQIPEFLSASPLFSGNGIDKNAQYKAFSLFFGFDIKAARFLRYVFVYLHINREFSESRNDPNPSIHRLTEFFLILVLPLYRCITGMVELAKDWEVGFD
jgi:hypothetical protein